MMKIEDIFGQPLNVVNVGLESMAQSLRDQGVPVVDVDWRPPAGGVSRLRVTRDGADVDAANEEVCRRIRQGRPVLVGMGIARDVIPGMHDRMILHAGPPITWERMCGPQRGAVMGALIYEGIARDEPEAERIAASGGIEFAPCHHHHAVGPMAGVVSPRMPVFIIENKTFGNRAFCTQNEGLGKVLRYGGMGPEVYDRLRWMETDLYPALDRALQSCFTRETLRVSRREPLSIGFAIGYLWRKAGEVTNLRLVGRGKYAGLPRAEIEALMVPAGLG